MCLTPILQSIVIIKVQVSKGAQYSEIPVIQAPLGPGVAHKSEKSISLKLCINNLVKKFQFYLTTLIEQPLL